MKETITTLFKQYWPGAEDAPLAVAVIVAVTLLCAWLVVTVKDRVMKLVATVKDRVTKKVADLAAFFKWSWFYAASVSFVIVVVTLLLLWVAKKLGIIDEFLSFLQIIGVIFAGALPWIVNQFSDQIRDSIKQSSRKFAGAEFHPQRPVSALEFVATDSLVKAKADDFVAKLKEAAEAADAESQFRLGQLYFTGKGVLQDDEEAVKWHRCAAEQGVAKAQFNLGLMYSKGKGVERDDAEAVKWYRFAAEQGLAESQNNLGLMYSKGKGVEQDYVEAVKWYRRAAEQGLAIAQFNLGTSYHNGQGVAQNYWEAYIWFSIAAGNEYEEAAKCRDVDAKLLSADDLAKAQAEAARRMEAIRNRAEGRK